MTGMSVLAVVRNSEWKFSARPGGMPGPDLVLPMPLLNLHHLK